MNILIAYGGKSCEHDISIITACLAKGFFKGEIYSVYFTKNNECYLVPNDWTPKKHTTEKLTKTVNFNFGKGSISICKGKRIVKTIPVDVAVNCCHGLHGEDGSIAAICAMTSIPLVGSGIIPSAVAIDKTVTKMVLSSMDMPVVKGFAVCKSQSNSVAEVADKLAFPVIVKPNKLGSSIGVEICRDEEQLIAALNRAFRYDDKVLCEEALTDFFELNCSALKADGTVETSVVDCPYTINDILTFNDKYIANEVYDKAVCEVPAELTGQVKELTKEIYNKLQFSGVIRVDYLFDKTTNKLYVNEINSIPGSLAYGLWDKRFTRTEFGEALVEEAIRDYRETQQHVFTFDSGVLSGGGKKK